MVRRSPTRALKVKVKSNAAVDRDPRITRGAPTPEWAICGPNAANLPVPPATRNRQGGCGLAALEPARPVAVCGGGGGLLVTSPGRIVVAACACPGRLAGWSWGILYRVPDVADPCAVCQDELEPAAEFGVGDLPGSGLAQQPEDARRPG
jgi:hypothetical protein